MMVLVTGCRGQLGFDICKQLSNLNIEYRGVDISDFDLTDGRATIAYVQKLRPNVIIHCAAYTAVDRAEEESSQCFSVNEGGTWNLANAAVSVGAKMLYISTDYVFDGTGNQPYSTSEKTNPQNVYGASKLAGEQAVVSQMERFFIVRTSWVFGLHGNNFVQTMLRLFDVRERVSVVCDQIGSPTYTVDLAKIICAMIHTERYGIYHVTNEGFCSWFDLASLTMKLSGKHCVVEPIQTEQYPTKAIRPKNSRLSKEKLIAEGFELLPTWQDALERYIRERKEAFNE